MANALHFSPGVDLVTDEAAVMMQERPVIGLSAWLIDAAAATQAEGRQLQLVTPPDVRLSFAARSRLFSGRNARWVVRDADEAYDGLTGIRLHWDGQKFAPASLEGTAGGEAERLGIAWAAAGLDVRANLQVLARVRYPALDTTVIGRATEFLFRELTGAPPGGWGTEEPVSQLWNVNSLTAYCHRRSPRPSLLTVVGRPQPDVRPAAGTVVVNSRPRGLEETVTMAVAQQGLEPPDPETVRGVVARLAEEVELVTVLVSAAGAAADTTSYPHFTGFPGPVGLAVGPDETRPRPDEQALPFELIGPASNPAAWYPLGDGTRMSDWGRLSGLLRPLLPQKQ